MQLLPAETAAYDQLRVEMRCRRRDLLRRLMQRPRDFEGALRYGPLQEERDRP